MGGIRVKRVYDEPRRDDGLRVLVDGVWPRGMTKEQVRADRWARELAPSPELRRWFAHDRSRWDEFRRRYFRELDTRRDAIDRLLAEARGRRITLLYSARDPECNQAVALAEYLTRRAKRPRRPRLGA